MADRSPRLRRVTFAGPELDGLTVEEPASSVRLLLPPAGSSELEMPTWTGNEFLLPNGERPVIRTFTPRRMDPESLELDLEIVVHGGGAASEWAASAEPGDLAAISGTGRGYTVDDEAGAFLLAGDETAIPAISQLLEALPGHARIDVRIEVAEPSARTELPTHPGATVRWHDLDAGAPPGDALFEAVREADIAAGLEVWVAGEAAAVQRIRKHLFDERGLTRSEATVRGYWKRGRAAS